LLGLIVTLGVVVAYSAYITWQVAGLRKLQSELIDRNRKDSLQLLRIQNDLNLLAVAMRDMIDSDEPYPLTAWSAQFQRIRTDLDDAMRLEPDAGAERFAQQFARAVLGRGRPCVRVGGFRARQGCEGSDPALAAGSASGAKHDRGSSAGAEQRERRAGSTAHCSDL
jgi:hypothetical protein